MNIETVKPVDVRLRESIFQWGVDKLLPLLIAGIFSVGVFIFAQGKLYGVHEELDKADRASISETKTKVDKMDERLRVLELLAAQQTVINQNLESLLRELQKNQR